MALPAEAGKPSGWTFSGLTTQSTAHGPHHRGQGVEKILTFLSLTTHFNQQSFIGTQPYRLVTGDQAGFALATTAETTWSAMLEVFAVWPFTVP